MNTIPTHRREPRVGNDRKRGRYGVLLSTTGQIHPGFRTRLLAAVEGRQLTEDQPDARFEVMKATPRGWRSAKGHTPDQVMHTVWGIEEEQAAA